MNDKQVVILLIFFVVVFFAAVTTITFGLNFVHFEDGSFAVYGCLPWEICSFP